MATVTGAGPKSSDDVMKNVSATEMLASTDATLIVNEPVATARLAKSSHSSGCGVAGSNASEWATTSAAGEHDNANVDRERVSHADQLPPIGIVSRQDSVLPQINWLSCTVYRRCPR